MFLIKHLLVVFVFSLLVACGGDEHNDTTIIVNCDGDTQQDVDSGSIDIVCIDSGASSPTRTTEVLLEVNLSASAESLTSEGLQLTTEGAAIGVAQAGLQNATSTTLASNTFTLPLPNNFSSNPIEFDVTLSGQGENIGTVSVSLDDVVGVPSTVLSFNDLRILASVINAQIFSPSGGQAAIDVSVDAIDDGGGNYRLEFVATEEGLTSFISLTDQSVNASQIGLSDPTPSSSAGVPRVDNGYPALSLEVSQPGGATATYDVATGESAEEIASGISMLAGVSATARTVVTLSNYTNFTGDLGIAVNGVSLEGDSFATLETEINLLSNTTLPNLSASLSGGGLELQLISDVGDDIEVSISGGVDGDSLTVTGNPLASPQVLEVDIAADGVTAGAFSAEVNAVVVGGSIDLMFEDGYDLVQPTVQGLIQPLSPAEYTDVVLNVFSPEDSNTYNYSLATTIYDSLGVDHQLDLYFVKQQYDVTNPQTVPNHWHLYVLVDGYDVGDPDTTLPPPFNTEATPATYDVYFNNDGSINLALSDVALISNWVPRDARGEPSGAAGPINVLAGAVVPIPEPPTSSNFVIDFEGLTQFGTESVTYDIEQNGASGG